MKSKIWNDHFLNGQQSQCHLCSSQDITLLERYVNWFVKIGYRWMRRRRLSIESLMIVKVKISYLYNSLERLVTFLICSSFLQVFTDTHIFPEENFSMFFQPIKHLNCCLTSHPPRLTSCHWPAWHPPGTVWAPVAGGAWSSWRATWTRAGGGGRGSRGWRRARGWPPPGSQQRGPRTWAAASAPGKRSVTNGSDVTNKINN